MGYSSGGKEGRRSAASLKSRNKTSAVKSTTTKSSSTQPAYKQPIVSPYLQIEFSRQVLFDRAFEVTDIR